MRFRPTTPRQCCAQAKEREAVKAGKKPFYLKKGELRKAELVEKYKVR